MTMGDSYRRDRFDNNPREAGRGYSRDEEYRSRDHYPDRRDARYSPPPRSRSRDRYPDRGRDDHSYRDRDPYKNRRDERNDRGDRDSRDSRDYPRESPDRGPVRITALDAVAEPYGRSPSPLRRHSEDFDVPPPSGPRADRYKDNYDDSHDAGKPNSQIIFRGLEKNITEPDLERFLLNQGAAVESVIVIRDKQTRESRGFAFVKFFAVEAAQLYMEQYYPAVQMGDSRVKIAYSLGRGEEDNGWTCQQCSLVNFPRRDACYRCALPRNGIPLLGLRWLIADVMPSDPPRSLTQKAWVYNDGTGDMGESPTQFLLVRNLDTMLQEETIAKGLAKLDVIPKRVLLIRDRKTKVSWGFAFIEYQDVSYAQSALGRYHDHKSFKIEKSKVKISFCHPGVFVPVYADPGKYTFKIASGTTVAYWDEHGYASEWSQLEKETPKDPEMEKFYNDLKVAETLHSTAASIIAEPVLRPAKPTESESTKRESSTIAEQQKKKRKIETVAVGRKPAAQLEKWATKRQELKGERTQPTTATVTEQGVSQFADLNQMCCLLCKRKFQSVEEIQKHERMSKLHKTNLTDDNIRNACLEKMQSALKPVPPPATENTSSSAYRDRARERRIQFNQPNRPDLPHPNPRIAAKQAAAAAAAKTPSPEPEPQQNKGAKLLAAMGWTEGSGLGAEGTGIVEPVKAGSYAEGVGLGAGSVKVVGEDIGGKDDDGSYRAYVRKVKDVAKGRYESIKDD